TSVPGIKISQYLPKIAKQMEHMAIVRSMSTKEADHGRATYQMRTGRVPGGPIQYPTLGSLVAKELETEDAELPSFVSIAPLRFPSPGAFDAGFPGPQSAPLIVGEGGNGLVQVQVQGRGQQQDIDQLLKVQDLDLANGVSDRRSASRVQLLDE